MKERRPDERLEQALISFIEREAKEPSSDAAVQVLPMMVLALIKLWEH